MRAFDRRKQERLLWKRLAQSGKVPHPSTGSWVAPVALPRGADTNVAHFQAGHRIGRH